MHCTTQSLECFLWEQTMKDRVEIWLVPRSWLLADGTARRAECIASCAGWWDCGGVDGVIHNGGARQCMSVTFFMKCSTCLSVSALCNVSSGVMLCTWKPSARTHTHARWTDNTELKSQISSSCNPISELQGVTCYVGSNSVTCHLIQANTPWINNSRWGW